MKKKLKILTLKLIIKTFDTIQGEEREIVFYSMVDSKNKSNIKYNSPELLEIIKLLKRVRKEQYRISKIRIDNRDLYVFKVSVKPEYKKYLK